MNLSNKSKTIEDAARGILEGTYEELETEELSEATKIKAWTSAGKSGKEYAELTQFTGPAELGHGQIGNRKMVQITIGKKYIELNARDLEILIKNLKNISLK